MFTEYGYYFYPIVFVLGASFGSFYFNLAYRILVYHYSPMRKEFSGLARWKQILLSPSECENCSEKISGLRLIPIFGYFLSRGKCPHCGYQIPIIYPLGEISFGFLAILILELSGNPLVSLVFVLFTGHLLISVYTDAKYFSLDYENLIWIFFLGCILNLLINQKIPELNDVFVFFGFLGFFLAIYLFYPKGIGFGDVLFAPIFAFLAGHPWWLLFLNASYIPAVVFTVLLKKKGASIRETPIPMGVYFCLGLFCTMIAKLVFLKFGWEIGSDVDG
ncbi:MAG: prepilin peptidase [Leptospira sp.]|nr:prepilin peptidase [Leptospira sp.]